MTINLKAPELRELKPRIMVCGVGGAGGNAVNNMIVSGLIGVDFIVANTDAQALTASKADRIIQMGLQVTEGLGAGSQPEVGRAAAEEALEEIRDHLAGAHMVFVTAGMGGGTGTGAAPVIARIARDMGILTVGVVTKPFQFEGQRRMRIADGGISELHKAVDTLITIPNQNLFRIANEKTTVRRRLLDGRPGALFRRGLHHRPDGQGRPHQPRLRRRPRHYARDGQGDDGHRRSVGRQARDPRRRSRHRQPAARRSLDEGRQGPAHLDHRRQRPHPLRGRRSREPHPPGSGRGRQHHPWRDLRREPRRNRPRLGRRDRHRQGRRPARASCRRSPHRRRSRSPARPVGGTSHRSADAAGADQRASLSGAGSPPPCTSITRPRRPIPAYSFNP